MGCAIHHIALNGKIEIKQMNSLLIMSRIRPVCLIWSIRCGHTAQGVINQTLMVEGGTAIVL